MTDTDANSPALAAARMDFGCGYYTGLCCKPMVMPDPGPGHVVIVLAELSSGHPVLIDVTDLAWLDQLESAIRVARAEGVVEAGMRLEATP